MTLQKAVFFAGLAVHVVGLIAALAMVVGVIINIFSDQPLIALEIPVYTFAASLIFRLMFALWLKGLGGIPPEYRTR